MGASRSGFVDGEEDDMLSLADTVQAPEIQFVKVFSSKSARGVDCYKAAPIGLEFTTLRMRSTMLRRTTLKRLGRHQGR